jgi:chitin synthase
MVLILPSVVSYQLILVFSSVMILPLLWYILIVVWQPRGFKGRVQYLLGLCIYVCLGPFLNLFVLTYALWSIDNFAWGKTRQVVEVKEEKEARGISEKTTPPSMTGSEGQMV